MPRAKTPEERAAKYAAAMAAGLTRGPELKPFEPGNDMAVKSAMYSPAVLNPIVEAKLAWMLGPDFPEHIKAPYLRPILREAATTEAQIELLDAEIAKADIVEANTEHTTTKERVTGSVENGNMRRTAHTRKTMTPLETRRRLSAHLERLWEQLGLTPMARAKLGKDVSETNVNLAKLMSEEPPEH